MMPISTPGMAPPINKSLTETPTLGSEIILANRIMVMLGGMMGPRPPDAAIVAQEKDCSYPVLRISEIAIMPIPAATAAAEPDLSLIHI